MQIAERIRAIAKLNLIGHSFGSLVSLLYAATYPGRTGSLVLYATAPPFIPELAKQLGARMAERRTPEDDAEKEHIERSEEFARRDPRALERYSTALLHTCYTGAAG